MHRYDAGDADLANALITSHAAASVSRSVPHTRGDAWRLRPAQDRSRRPHGRRLTARPRCEARRRSGHCPGDRSTSERASESSLVHDTKPGDDARSHDVANNRPGSTPTVRSRRMACDARDIIGQNRPHALCISMLGVAGVPRSRCRPVRSSRGATTCGSPLNADDQAAPTTAAVSVAA